MDPLRILKKYYDPRSDLYRLLLLHSEAVAQKALAVAETVAHLDPDRKFLFEAAMLHDIGIFLTDSPEIECTGSKPYVCHGYLGREILEAEGFPQHALVCERHVGVGITKEEIIKRNLPLPLRDMIPVSIEEQIICFADKFFSKDKEKSPREKTVDEVINGIAKLGADNVKQFEDWLALFEDRRGD